MRTYKHLVVAIAVLVSVPAHAQPRPAPVTRADVERLERRIEEQQKQLEKLLRLHKQYLELLTAVLEGTTPPEPPKPLPPRPVTEPPRPPRRVVVRPQRPKPAAGGALGSVTGRVVGAPDAIVYIDDIVAPTTGSVSMKQQNKQFVPQVVIAPKGTTVQFPNMDAVFHNVFSMTPSNSFDLGIYRQGESKSMVMTTPGVISVFCNIHPQMIGYILVVPNPNYVRVAKDGTFKLTNVPVGRHRVVAWAPNAKAVGIETDITEGAAATVALDVKKGPAVPHQKKDGLPYSTYE